MAWPSLQDRRRKEDADGESHLRFGSNGSDVQELQRGLNLLPSAQPKLAQDAHQVGVDNFNYYSLS